MAQALAGMRLGDPGRGTELWSPQVRYICLLGGAGALGGGALAAVCDE